MRDRARLMADELAPVASGGLSSHEPTNLPRTGKCESWGGRRVGGKIYWEFAALGTSPLEPPWCIGRRLHPPSPILFLFSRPLPGGGREGNAPAGMVANEGGVCMCVCVCVCV